MFRCKACSAKDKEIEHLRSMVHDLQDRLMSFTEHAMETYKVAKNAEGIGESLYGTVMGTLESMKAETEEDVKDKEAARSQFLQLIGH